MVQTLTVWADGTAEVNTGEDIFLCNGAPLTDALQSKLNSIESAISAAGISQVHVEKDTFREFEHVVSAGKVTANDFGTTVSISDFEWIVQHVESEISFLYLAHSEPEPEDGPEPELAT